MRNFREFEATDPFGRRWQVWFKWLQTGITLRHADTVDVKFVVEVDGERREKVIALLHQDLLSASEQTGHRLTDAWCSRLAALHLQHAIETGEDIEKDLITVTPNEIAAYDAQLKGELSASRAG